MAKPIKSKRPKPRDSFFDDAFTHMRVEPSEELKQWVFDSIISPTGKLHNEDHEILVDADIQFMFASGGFSKKQKVVIGQAEKVQFMAGGWQRARQIQQMMDWFGYVPEFIITLDAQYCASCSDSEFCALVEHELYHIRQKLDAFGEPKFNDEGGPSFEICGHDVEEFIGVVRRYGASEQVNKMVQAAKRKPEVSAVNIAHSCGTCLKATN